MAIRALVFDFDGVVIDTETPDFATWQEVFDDHGVGLDHELWSGFIGGGPGEFDVYDHLEELVGRALDRDVIRADRRRRYLDAVESSPVLPGVEALVLDARAHSLRLAVASSSGREWVEGHLEMRGLLSYFEPDPELFASALDALGVEPADAIGIEDSANGVTAATVAGMFCVVVPNAMTEAMPLDHADLRLRSLAGVSLDYLIEAATAHTGAGGQRC